MRCPKCGSQNVNVQVVNEMQLKNAHHGILWWLFVGWWWIFVKWIFFTIPALFAAFLPKRQKIRNKQKGVWVCQNCGNTWNA